MRRRYAMLPTATGSSAAMLPMIPRAAQMHREDDAMGTKTKMQEKGPVSRVASSHTWTRPTPIRISKQTRNLLLLAGVAALVLLMWLSPSVPIMLLGGVALALHLSFPVRALSRFMPRRWATLVSFLVLVGLVVIGLVVLVPILIGQLISFISNVQGYGSDIGQFVQALLEPLYESRR